jgi:hypothetical protein
VPGYSELDFYAPEGAEGRGVLPEDIDWPVKKICAVKVVDKKAVYQVQFNDNSKQ